MKHGVQTIIAACFITLAVNAQTTANNRFGLNRIVSGWTNYSTGFTTTDDGDEFATVASFFTPAVDVSLLEFGVIVVPFGGVRERVNFADFTFRIHVWSGLDAFVANPRHGDVAAFSFSAPTGGSSTVPDTRTRGGRDAFHIRFALTNSSLVLSQCHTYLVGFATITASTQAGELFVPTAPFAGDSDVQAGNIVPFGWPYLLSSGGTTIYYGQLATELRVQPLGTPPSIRITVSDGELVLTWPENASCYTLQWADALLTDNWILVTNAAAALEHVGPTRLDSSHTRYFRLIKDSPNIFTP